MNNNQKLSEETIYHQLKKLLFTGDIAYGERFTEMQISEKLNVSRMPVREAMKQLSYEGFIEKTETTGFQIKNFTEQDIIDTYIYRECLDGMITNLFTYKYSPSQIYYLESLLATMEQNKDSGNELLMSQLDQEFHMTIARGAGNQQMLVQFEILLEKMLFISHVLIHNKLPTEINKEQIYTPEHSLSIYLEHKEIIDYIKKNDPEGAERCARKSIKEGLKKVLRMIVYQYNHIQTWIKP